MENCQSLNRCSACNFALDGKASCGRCGKPEIIDDLSYLNKIERLAHEVIEAAYSSDLQLDLGRTPETPADSLLGALEELARSLRHYHYQNDPCGH